MRKRFKLALFLVILLLVGALFINSVLPVAPPLSATPVVITKIVEVSETPAPWNSMPLSLFGGTKNVVPEANDITFDSRCLKGQVLMVYTPFFGTAQDKCLDLALAEDVVSLTYTWDKGELLKTTKGDWRTLTAVFILPVDLSTAVYGIYTFCNDVCHVILQDTAGLVLDNYVNMSGEDFRLTTLIEGHTPNGWLIINYTDYGDEAFANFAFGPHDEINK